MGLRIITTNYLRKQIEKKAAENKNQPPGGHFYALVIKQEENKLDLKFSWIFVVVEDETLQYWTDNLIF